MLLKSEARIIVALLANEIKLWLTRLRNSAEILVLDFQLCTHSLSPLGVQNKDLCAASQMILIRV